MSILLNLSQKFLQYSTACSRNQLEEALQNPQLAQESVKRRIQATQNEKVLFYESTSGSTGQHKKIPYTRSLRKAFSSMFSLWAWDVLQHAPIKFNSGVLYMSISPRTPNEVLAEDDRQYVSGLLRPVLNRFLAVDPTLQNLHSTENFYNQLAQALLKRRDLEIISIWSPSFFLSLMEYVEKNAERLRFEGSWQKVWPNLKMISSWDSAQAMQPAETLKRKLPHAWFQGKGLLATEGPMTMPWISAKAKIPLLTQTYFQFQDQRGNLFKLHELQEGEIYELIPSFMNGLIDYPIGDFVQVTHFYRQTPCLEFVGRGQETSDLVGEKLSGNLVRDLLKDLPLEFFVLIPQGNHYLLLWDGQQQNLSQEFEKRLLQVYHYNLARNLNQLNPLIAKRAPGLLFKYRELALQENMKQGNLKEKNIITQKNLAAQLEKWALAICE